MEKSSIVLLRKKMSERGIYVMIIPSNDIHFGEYIPDHYKIREGLSGFDGSAGTLVVSLDDAALWTDSRYFEQAEQQLAGSGIALMKMKVKGVPGIPEWIASLSDQPFKVAVTGSLYSVADFEALSSELLSRSEGRIALTAVEDFFSEVLENRPALVFNEIIAVDGGESILSKRERLMKPLIDCYGQNPVYFTQLCDEIAWSLNLRGSDIEFNPVFLSYMLVYPEKTVLFAQAECMSEDVLSRLHAASVEVFPYASVEKVLSEIDSSCVLVCRRSALSYSFYRILEDAGIRLFDDPVTQGRISVMKAAKSRFEQEGMICANLYDGAAWVKFLKYIDDHFSSGLLDEYGVSRKIMETRKGNHPDYRGESFHPIVAFNSNAAMAHYEPLKDRSAKLSGSGFLLIDTGAHYVSGTTDVTRTLAFGEVSHEMKLDYTLILKGMIDLSMAVFPEGTRGDQLDFLARGPICQAGRIYMHGTGHGIGTYLNVHEGPQSIRMEHNPMPLLEGMVTSNEPAVYVPGKYGIRIEDSILCRRSEFDGFYCFDTINLVPIESRLIDTPEYMGRYFSVEERTWLREYNERVYRELSPLLSEEELSWFRAKYL